MHDLSIADKGTITRKRLLASLAKTFTDREGQPEWEAFCFRFNQHFSDLFEALYHLYGDRFDLHYHLESLAHVLAECWIQRPDELRGLDAIRESDPTWYRSGHLIGAMAYVDEFAEDLAGLEAKIPYLKELGITYLHLMPVYRSPDGDDDGGYAVTSYREIDPDLGNIDDLRRLASELRRHGISLVLDFVCNHTSDEHVWATAAMAGDRDFQDYYFMFPEKSQVDEYEQQLRSIFPDDKHGSFTYFNKIKKWVWTTFHNYQFDLNYQNPEVFCAMVRELLFVANIGTEVLRMDAVPFIWKQNKLRKPTRRPPSP